MGWRKQYQVRKVSEGRKRRAPVAGGFDGEAAQKGDGEGKNRPEGRPLQVRAEGDRPEGRAVWGCGVVVASL